MQRNHWGKLRNHSTKTRLYFIHTNILNIYTGYLARLYVLLIFKTRFKCNNHFILKLFLVRKKFIVLLGGIKKSVTGNVTIRQVLVLTAMPLKEFN